MLCYIKAMKEINKISLQSLPPPLESALREQFAKIDGVMILSADSLDPVDLVISAVPVDAPGCPVLMVTARVRLGDVLRQAVQMLSQPALYLNDVQLDGGIFRPQEKLFLRDDGIIAALTAREVDILAYLLRRREPVSRDELLRAVWRYHNDVDSHTLETHIYRLRQKIERITETPRLLVTVEGGYCIKG